MVHFMETTAQYKQELKLTLMITDTHPSIAQARLQEQCSLISHSFPHVY